MRTTIDLPDDVLAEAKVVTQRSGGTLRELVVEGLILALARRQSLQGSYRLPDCAVAGRGLRPEVSSAPWSSLRDLAYGIPEDPTDSSR